MNYSWPSMKNLRIHGRRTLPARPPRATRQHIDAGAATGPPGELNPHQGRALQPHLALQVPQRLRLLARGAALPVRQRLAQRLEARAQQERRVAVRDLPRPGPCATDTRVRPRLHFACSKVELSLEHPP